jgi:tetratricopeptide (TPR) repeat protein
MYWVREIEVVYPDGRSKKNIYLLCNSFEEFIADTAGVIGAPCVWAAHTGTRTRAAARENAKGECKPLDFKRNPHLSPNVMSAMNALGAVVSAAIIRNLHGAGDEEGLLEVRELVINKQVGKEFYIAFGYIPGYESIFDGTINKNAPETGETRSDYAYAYAYSDIGMAYYVNHDYTKAIACLSTAIKIVPDYAVAYYTRGAGYFAMHDFDNAAKDVTRYLAVDPANAQAQELLRRIIAAASNKSTTTALNRRFETPPSYEGG